jgi:hypothetical protein
MLVWSLPSSWRCHLGSDRCVRVQVGESDLKQPLLAPLPAFGLVDTIDARIRCGGLTSDATQYGYLLALMSAPHRQMPVPGTPQPLSEAVATGAQWAQPHGSAAGASGGAAGSSAQPSAAEVQAEVEAVKEVLPDTGAGFVEACLQHMGWDAAAVINGLLTGELPAAVAKLDRAATTNPLAPAPAQASSSGAANSRHTGGHSNAAGDASTGGRGALSWGQTHGVDMGAQARAAAQHALQVQPGQAKSSKYAGAHTLQAALLLRVSAPLICTCIVEGVQVVSASRLPCHVRAMCACIQSSSGS